MGNVGVRAHQPSDAREVFATASDGSNVRRFRIKTIRFLRLEMNPPETFWFEGAEVRSTGNADTSAEIRRDEEVPLLVLLHGGPQTMWSNAWATDGTRKFFPRRDT